MKKKHIAEIVWQLVRIYFDYNPYEDKKKKFRKIHKKRLKKIRKILEKYEHEGNRRSGPFGIDLAALVERSLGPKPPRDSVGKSEKTVGRSSSD
jgi:hypothetical protein